MEREVQEEFIKVAIRCRPLSKRETEQNPERVVEIDQANNSIIVKYKNNEDKIDIKTFKFDLLFDMNSTQDQIYLNVASPIIEGVLQGQNGTIFTYGQTGAGKNFTIYGIDCVEGVEGILPRAIKDIFNRIEVYRVYASMYEIYLESITDLLAEKYNNSLTIRQNILSGIYIQDLIQKQVNNAEELHLTFQKGNKFRLIKSTNMSCLSSRAYVIYEVLVERECLNSRVKKVATLKVIKFAGSERQPKTSASSRFNENMRIGVSNSCFCNVINALSQEKSSHIPYRDSKLTRIMQESLGGNTRTAMICNISSSTVCQDETICSLRLAKRVEHIRNKIQVNQYPLPNVEVEEVEEQKQSEQFNPNIQIQKEKQEIIQKPATSICQNTDGKPQEQKQKEESKDTQITQSNNQENKPEEYEEIEEDINVEE